MILLLLHLTTLLACTLTAMLVHYCVRMGQARFQAWNLTNRRCNQAAFDANDRQYSKGLAKEVHQQVDEKCNLWPGLRLAQPIELDEWLDSMFQGRSRFDACRWKQPSIGNG